jgi:hypothetical protein
MGGTRGMLGRDLGTDGRGVFTGSERKMLENMGVFSDQKCALTNTAIDLPVPMTTWAAISS